MTNPAHARDVATTSSAFPESVSASGLRHEPVVTLVQQPTAVPAPPAAPAAPRVQGMPEEARQAIENAVRQAQQEAARARAEALAAQAEARAQAGVRVDGERVIVTPDGAVTVGGGSGGGSGRGGQTIQLPPPGGRPFDDIPPQAFDLAIAFFIMIAFISVGTPLARALGRKVERRPVAAPANPELAAQLLRIEHAVEAMAIEVERISEAQRYMARLESERGADQGLLARPSRRE